MKRQITNKSELNLSDPVKNLKPMVKITVSPQDDWHMETDIIERSHEENVLWNYSAKVGVRKGNHKFILNIENLQRQLPRAISTIAAGTSVCPSSSSLMAFQMFLKAADDWNVWKAFFRGSGALEGCFFQIK